MMSFFICLVKKRRLHQDYQNGSSLQYRVSQKYLGLDLIHAQSRLYCTCTYIQIIDKNAPGAQILCIM